jgi:hypothetical protein
LRTHSCTSIPEIQEPELVLNENLIFVFLKFACSFRCWWMFARNQNLKLYFCWNQTRCSSSRQIFWSV